MACRGKALQWAALPLLVLAVLISQAFTAAVHRADGVDAATARLLGEKDDSVVSQAALPSSGNSDPTAYFAPDSWRPVWRDLAERRSSSSRHEGAPVQELFISGPRTFRAEKLGESGEVVVTPHPVRFSTVAATPSGEAKQRGPEVHDSIAAVASQLLSNKNLPVLDVRTPPRMQQQQAIQEATATPNPVSKTTLIKENDAEWSLVATNNSPLRITTVQTKPITKVPPISKLSTPLPKISPLSMSKNENDRISTRFPPRKPSLVGITTEVNPMVKKAPVVEITSKKPVTQSLTTVRKSVVEITTKKPVTESLVTKKPEMLVTTTKKPSTVIYKRPSTPVAVTILKKTNNSITTTITATTPGRPIISITEKIPTISTKAPEVSTVAKVEKLSNSYSKVSDLPSAALYEKIAPNVKTPSVIVKTPSASIKTSSTVTKVPYITSTTKMAEVSSSTVAPAASVEITTVSAVSSTTKRTRRPTKKKNKNRRRRPAKPTTPKPEDSIETKEGVDNLTGLTKPNKPLSTRIYQFISRDVMPNFGMGIMGILVTAGLAGLLLLPIDGFTRRSDVYKREEEEGLIPSVIQAVMTSLNIGEQKYHEEQGPRRYKRQSDSENEVIESDIQPSFSFLRFLKQALAIKLDIVSNMLRVASEALRNYAQNGPEGRPQSTTESYDSNSTDNLMVEVSTINAESPASSTEENAPEITTQQSSEENEEENFVRRRTHL